ncbi:UNVERIFIED_CONTAM: hypothetical protein FKN15_054835 [Acipenser sinensis]
MSSSHPNNCSVPVDHAQTGSSGQKNFGGGLQTCPPFFMAGSSPPWGSGHPFSCSEIAAGGAGLLTSPPFFMVGSCPSWGSSHSISCPMAGLVATPGKTGPSGGYGSSCKPSAGDGSSSRPLGPLGPLGGHGSSSGPSGGELGRGAPGHGGGSRSSTSASYPVTGGFPGDAEQQAAPGDVEQQAAPGNAKQAPLGGA